jgi:hypothetical protein
MYITSMPEKKKQQKKIGKIAQGLRDGGQLGFSAKDWPWMHITSFLAGTPG